MNPRNNAQRTGRGPSRPGWIAICIILFLQVFSIPQGGAQAQDVISFGVVEVKNEFPDGLTFKITASSSEGEITNAKLVYNNSPSFNWTLNFRQQVFDAWVEEGKDVSAYDRDKLMSIDYDGTELSTIADEKIRTFQADSSREAGIFHHLITLPTYHTAALSTDTLAKEYFGDLGMLGYVLHVQREEIRNGIACVKHQNMSGSDIGDDHKEYFSGDAALKAGGEDNTMNQFS